jgi:multiple sugar transport system substrate-binding protein
VLLGELTGQQFLDDMAKKLTEAQKEWEDRK